MGEIADAMLDGFVCHICGEVIDEDEPGYPRTCAACEEEEKLYANQNRMV